MYRHILIPTDGSDTAAKAITAGIELAKESGAKLTLFTAVPPYELPGEADVRMGNVLTPDEHHRRSKDKAESILADPLRLARAAGLDSSTYYLESDHPYQAIIDAAELNHCDLIVMSSHGRQGLAELWYGSETRAVLTHSHIPTLVYR